MARESILVVDDNPVNLKLVRVLLAREGYNVRGAADAEEALDLLKDFSPDLILMDIQLPGIDGLELTRRLKADPATRRITIVALTAYAMKGDHQKVLEAGCDGYIPKPIDTRTLPQLIVNYLQKQSPASEAG
jgi:CheY-like chemotaxis protein